MARFDATLNDIKLEMEAISDSFDKAISRRHIPFSDKTILRDMGLRSRRIRLRCYFWADTYESHKELLKLLWKRKSFELNHPAYGLLKGKVTNVNVRHDDREETAEVDLDFIVGDSRITVSASTDVRGDAEDLAQTGYKEIEQDYRDKLVEKSVLPAEVVDMELDPEQDILDQVDGLAPDARAYIKKLDQMAHDLSEFSSGITAPVDSLVDQVDFAMNIPGRMIGTIASTVEKLTVRFISLKNAPTRFVDSIKNQLSRFSYPFDSTLFGSSSSDSDSITVADRLSANALVATAAIGLSTAVAEIYADDETVRVAQAQAESTQVFDSSGRMAEVASAELALNVREIESSLYAVREISELAVEGNRELESVKLLADTLLDHVVQVKLDAEKIITIEVDNEIPLHLVCLKYGLPYRAAERIMLINRIKHPNFVRGRVDIYES